jgi:hypothetical protein
MEGSGCGLIFKLLFQNLSGGTEKKHKNCQASRYLGRELNPGPPEYEAGVLASFVVFLSSSRKLYK